MARRIDEGVDECMYYISCLHGVAKHAEYQRPSVCPPIASPQLRTPRLGLPPAPLPRPPLFTPLAVLSPAPAPAHALPSSPLSSSSPPPSLRVQNLHRLLHRRGRRDPMCSKPILNILCAEGRYWSVSTNRCSAGFQNQRLLHSLSNTFYSLLWRVHLLTYSRQ